MLNEIGLDLERFPTSVVEGEGNRAYMGNGHLDEGVMRNSSRECFSIELVISNKRASNFKGDMH